MASPLVEELRGRLSTRHAALRALGHLADPKPFSVRAWADLTRPVRRHWLLKGAAVSSDDPASDRRRVQLREGVEALALLRALACVDYRAFVQQVREIWTPTRAVPDVATMEVDAAPPHFGCVFPLTSSNDFTAIAERVVDAQPPTAKYLRDYAWLEDHKTNFAHVVDATPVPVLLDMCLDPDAVEELAHLLDQILQSAIAQNLLSHMPHTAAESSAQFQIEEVEFADPSTAVNVEALECLHRLVVLGVRVPYLPCVQVKDNLAKTRLALVSAFRALLLSPHVDRVEKPVENVRTYDGMADFLHARDKGREMDT